METVTPEVIRTFLERLSRRYTGEAAIYLLGGSALCLVGSPRVTQDIDYTLGVVGPETELLQAALGDLAARM